jgi:hypothetical protein
VFYRNETYFKEPLYFLGSESNISPAEVQAGDWLSKNAPSGSLLVSDPSTQAVLEAASGVNSQGGPYMSLETRRVLESINRSDDYGAVAERLLTIQDNLAFERQVRTDTLFVLSGRYFAWQQFPSEQKESFYYNIWQPVLLDPGDQGYINGLVDSHKFNLLYRNSELAILRVS